MSPHPLVWTKQPPTVPGWYWRMVLRNGTPHVLSRGVLFYDFDGIDKLYCYGDGGWSMMAGAEMRWAGPIALPVEAEGLESIQYRMSGSLGGRPLGPQVEAQS